MKLKKKILQTSSETDIIKELAWLTIPRLQILGVSDYP